MSAEQIGVLEATIAEFAGNSASMDKIAAHARACWTPEHKADTPAQLKKYSVDALVNVAYFVQKIAQELDAVLVTQRCVVFVALCVFGVVLCVCCCTRGGGGRCCASKTRVVISHGDEKVSLLIFFSWFFSRLFFFFFSSSS